MISSRVLRRVAGSIIFIMACSLAQIGLGGDRGNSGTQYLIENGSFEDGTGNLPYGWEKDNKKLVVN